MWSIAVLIFIVSFVIKLRKFCFKAVCNDWCLCVSVHVFYYDKALLSVCDVMSSGISCGNWGAVVSEYFTWWSGISIIYQANTTWGLL